MRIFLSFVFLLCAVSVARADQITTFDLNAYQGNVQGQPFSFSGSFAIDTTTGEVVPGTYIFNANGTAIMLTFVGAGYDDGYLVAGFQKASDGILRLVFPLPTMNLQGYAGGDLCSTAEKCPDGIGSLGTNFVPSYPTTVHTVFFASATLTPEVATTPEPASLWLLSTCAPLILAAVRRRSRTRFL